MKTKSFALGVNFPNEGFVQSAIEAHFSKCGFTLETDTYADLACRHSETGERWVIEAKGVTTAIGLDFRTGLGQLVQRMSDESFRYGMAIPADERFLAQCRLVSTWLRERLSLYWLIVSEDGALRIVGPKEQI